MPGGVTSASCTVSKMTSITPSPHDGTITRGDQNCARSQPKLVTTAAAPMRAQGDAGVSAGFARTQVKPTRLPSANQKAPPCTCTLSHARQ